MNLILKKIKSFQKKESNKELINDSFLSLIIRLLGSGAAFLMNVIIARYIGAEEAGFFFLSISVTTILASVGRIGSDQTVLRFVSIHSENKEWELVHAIVKKMMSWTYLPLIAISFLLCLFAKPLSVYLFHKEALTDSIFWTGVAMPFFAAYNLLGMALQGRRKVALSVSVIKIITPLFLILFILVFNPAKSSTASFYYAIACIINLLAAYWLWYKNVPQVQNIPNYNSQLLWKSCSPLWVSSIMQQVTVWGGQFIAGIYLGSADVAQLAVARNMTVMITFILGAVNNVSSARFASMYSKGQMDELKKYVRNSTLLMTAVALPVTLVIMIFPEFIMSLFGESFTSGATVLRILALGQFISVASGSVGNLLAMSGHEKDLQKIRIMNGVLAIVLAFALTPYFGAIGSAVSTAVSLAFFNFMCIGYVKKRLGFSTLTMFGLK